MRSSFKCVRTSGFLHLPTVANGRDLAVVIISFISGSLFMLLMSLKSKCHLAASRPILESQEGSSSWKFPSNWPPAIDAATFNVSNVGTVDNFETDF